MGEARRTRPGGRVASLRLVALGLPLLGAVSAGPLGCGDRDRGEDDGVAVTEPGGDASSSCPPPRARAGGACCPAGSYYDLGADGCVAVGPPECAALLYSSPASCVPRWCPAWRTVSGAPCSPDDEACALVGDACDGDGGAEGCLAGWWRRGAGPCSPAAGGLALAPTGTDSPGPDPPVGPSTAPAARTPPGPVRSPPGVPPAAAPPLVGQLGLCAGTSPGTVSLCQGGDAACGAGAMPDPAAEGSCLAVGPPWVCPPGFVSDPKPAPSPGLPSGCRPDPAGCGADPWGGVPDGPAVVHVAAGAPPGGDGSASKPFATLAAGVAGVSTGGTVVMASGQYEGVVVGRPMRLVGRCAAGVRVTGSPGLAAIRVAGAAAEGGLVRLQRMTLRGRLALLVTGGPAVVGEDLWAVDNEQAAVVVSGGGARVELHRVMTSRAGAASSFGLGVELGGRLDLTDVRVSGSQMIGVALTDPGTRLVARRLLVDGSRAAKGGFGFGVSVEDGARAELRSTLLTGNANAGAIVAGAGGVLHLLATRVEGTTRAASGQTFTAGVVVAGGARATLSGVRILGNVGSGLHVRGPGTAVAAQGVLIDDTRSDPLFHGTGSGIRVHDRASLSLDSVRVQGSRSMGVVARGAGVRLYAQRLLVDGTRAYPGDGSLGVGMEVAYGARAWLVDARLSRNRTMGLRVRGAGAEIYGERLLVDGTLPRLSDGAMGMGVHVGEGALARLRESRVSGNGVVGLRVADAGSRLRLVGSLVDGTRVSGPEGRWGTGVDVHLGARADLVGSRLTGNHMAGAVVAGEGARLSLSGTRVDHTAPEESPPPTGALRGGLGVGLYAIDQGAELDVRASLLRANSGAALAVSRARAKVEGSVVASTVPAVVFLVGPGGSLADAVKKELADGVVADSPALLAIERTLIVDNARAGLLMQGGAGGFRHSVATGGLFGVALQGEAALEEHESLLYGNENNHVGGLSLSLPEAPEVVGP